MVEKSHERSASYGLDAKDNPDFCPMNHADLTVVIEQNRLLHAYALPVMENLYEQIVNTNNMVILTDAQGVIMHTLGDDDFLEKANRVALTRGVTWSEQRRGTNAIGTAIADATPTLVHADEHYLRANHILTCSAAPIFNPSGKVIGVLDVTGDCNSFHRHTMALVRMSAQMIENQLFAASCEDGITLHFHTRPEFIGTLMEGIVTFTPGGRFMAANRSAMFQIGLPPQALFTHTLNSLFGMGVSALYDHYRTAAPQVLQMCLPSGVKIYARASIRLSNKLVAGAELAFVPPANAQAQHSARQDADSQRLSSLRYLNTGDPQVAAVIGKLTKVIGRDIPILINGETGTGKELLAQAIHNDSPRAGGPFVAVNCASIPETLIESELFGYEDGAFTGARKKGSVGKILHANGGTLFLDEIGDMPLNLQARLLRVLQERMVTPLGSAKSIPVNVSLICATHRNLRDMISRGEFREDLYYRLNGLVVKLPPVRERTDFETVVAKLLAAENGGRRFTIAPDVMALFLRYNWPGNFRQLTNLLRTAMVMTDEDNEIRMEHLPEDFLDDMRQMAASAPAEPTPPAATTALPAFAPAAAPAAMPGGTLEDAELMLIQRTLQSHGGNVSAAARVLGISRNTIYRKLQGQQ
ncbi:sigma-54-dependent Fis family transcriptional regulator [Noviherbaspirillum sp. 17J57-3]|uniref:Sigma-54-dependent Fis family transcriptional regulator n=2 Tax=Noviherbaspirillum galbum TaxID=2709383 RepID=A0A6B3SJN1_9BURK|nr:sigma-54-dependent Fis family transcriptional regulator [Noviherbaspirillum galbum]NEX61064.1 sigma-54-dependent Fis family transcriptional regulator [Noviherbaspirillum galbum]